MVLNSIQIYPGLSPSRWKIYGTAPLSAIKTLFYFFERKKKKHETN